MERIGRRSAFGLTQTVPSNSVIFTRRFDPGTGTFGSAKSVVDGVRQRSALASAGVPWFDVSATGTMVYLPAPMRATGMDSKLAWFDRKGT